MYVSGFKAVKNYNMDLEKKSNRELVNIINKEDETIKNKAGELLSASNPNSDDLYIVLRFSTSVELSKIVAAKLRERLNIVVPVDEDALIKNIAIHVLERPGSLDMNQWHCGTTHCIGGYACLLNPIAAELEKEYDTSIVAAAVLPNYVKHFHSSNSTALEVLKSVIAK